MQLPLGSLNMCSAELALGIQLLCCKKPNHLERSCVGQQSQTSPGLVPVVGVWCFQPSAVWVTLGHLQLQGHYGAAVKASQEKPSQLYFEFLTHRFHEYNKIASKFEVVCYTAVYNQNCLNVLCEQEIRKLGNREKEDLKLKKVGRNLSNSICFERGGWCFWNRMMINKTLVLCI